MDLNQLLDGIGLSKGTALASAAGAVLSLNWIDKSLKWSVKGSMILGGFVSATYGTPLAIDFFAIKASVAPSLAFFVGLFGMSLIDAAYAMFRDGTVLAFIKGRIQK